MGDLIPKIKIFQEVKINRGMILERKMNIALQKSKSHLKSPQIKKKYKVIKKRKMTYQNSVLVKIISIKIKEF